MELEGAWRGWRLQRVGKRKDESLVAPDGAIYCPSEILELNKLWLDLDYLQVENKRLEVLIEAHAIYLTTEQLSTLQNASTILTAVLPVQRFNRFNRCQSPTTPLAPLPTHHNVEQETRHNPPAARNVSHPLRTRAK